jgi:uncharacterized protein (TIGR02646 family)
LKAIVKGREPEQLQDYRDTPDCTSYLGYHDHGELKKALVDEQHGICCYCMNRVKYDTVRVEHWRCRDDFKELQLIYSNMLGVCYGGERERVDPALYHCDKTKGNKKLKYNPSNPAHRIEEKVYYEPNGKIRSNDPEFDIELKDVLNLNQDDLQKNRKEVYIRVVQWWASETRKNGHISKARLEREYRRWNEGSDQLESYCQVAVYVLKQRLERMNQ